MQAIEVPDFGGIFVLTDTGKQFRWSAKYYVKSLEIILGYALGHNFGSVFENNGRQILKTKAHLGL